MIIEIDKRLKIELLQALQSGCIDTARMPELFRQIENCEEFKNMQIIWVEELTYDN